MNFKQTREFSKEFKKLSKKYRSLLTDLRELKDALLKFPCGNSNNSIILHNYDQIKIIKARFACRYLCRSSLRIIYAFNQENNIIEFIELYFKGNKLREDKNRIRDYIKKQKL